MKSYFSIPCICCAIGAASLSSCGYHLGGSKPVRMANVNKVFVPTFKNETILPRAEVLMTSAFVEQLGMDGTYQVTSEQQADATIYCTIKSLKYRSVRTYRDNVNDPLELESTCNISYVVKDNAGNELMSGNVIATSNYFNVMDQQTERLNAFSYTARRGAIQLTTRLCNGF